MARKRFKRVAVVSDLHCGHWFGLTAPEFQLSSESKLRRWKKAAAIERESYDWYRRTIEELRPIDIVFMNGDAIDGRGERSGGTELVTTDRNKQVDMAYEPLALIRAKKYVMTYGTGYHTGDSEDFEDELADKLDFKFHAEVKIGSHEWPEVNGVVFDLKHHIGTSSRPHTRYTPLAGDELWNQLWALREEQPRADVIIRSHVHYHTYCGDIDYLAMTTPALQTMGTKYGSRRCSGIVHFGLVHFDVYDDGRYTWQAHVAKLRGQKAQTTKL